MREASIGRRQAGGNLIADPPHVKPHVKPHACLARGACIAGREPR